VPTTPKKDRSKPSVLSVISKRNNAGAGAMTFILVLDVSHGAQRGLDFPCTRRTMIIIIVLQQSQKNNFLDTTKVVNLLLDSNAPLRRKMP